MTFNNQYLTYAEYVELGGTLEELPFNKVEYECQKILDSKTQKRLANVSIIPDEVKFCIFKMIESISTTQTNIEITQKGIASENIDGYSVTYNSNTEQIIKSKNSELQDMVSTYLYSVIVNNEHLIYLGVKQ